MLTSLAQVVGYLREAVLVGLTIKARIGYLEGNRSVLNGRLEDIQKGQKDINGAIEDNTSLAILTGLRSKLDTTVNKEVIEELDMQDEIWQRINLSRADFLEEAEPYRKEIDISIETIEKTLEGITQYGEQGRPMAEGLLTSTHSSPTEEPGFVETLRSYLNSLREEIILPTIESLKNSFSE